jgi:hypothetical protein
MMAKMCDVFVYSKEKERKLHVDGKSMPKASSSRYTDVGFAVGAAQSRPILQTVGARGRSMLFVGLVTLVTNKCPAAIKAVVQEHALFHCVSCNVYKRSRKCGKVTLRRQLQLILGVGV